MISAEHTAATVQQYADQQMLMMNSMSQLTITPQMDVNRNQTDLSPEEGRKLTGRPIQNHAPTVWQQQGNLNYPPNGFDQQFFQPSNIAQQIPPTHQHLHHSSQLYQQGQHPAEYANQFHLPLSPAPHNYPSTYNPSAAQSHGRKNKTFSSKPLSNTSQAFRKKVATYPPKQTNRQPPAFQRSLSLGADPSYTCVQKQETLYMPRTTNRSVSNAPSIDAEEQVVEKVLLLLSPDDGICMGSMEENAADQGLGLVGKSIPSFERKYVKSLSTLDEESGSDSDLSDTHPNKFPIAIEEHTNRNCAYRRQPHRSGPQVKVVKKSGEVYSLTSPTETPEVEQDLMRRYYRKDLVRVCVCGKYETKEPLLENRGRDNDADGYEVHYNIKCKWKSYEDFKTKKRVIIRLCKCYKPSF